MEKHAQKRHFEMHLGVYDLDLGRTDLGEYAEDSSQYRGVTITFNKDSTFSLNMEVPFMYGSFGTWEASGARFEEWNRLFFDGKNIGEQFTEPWTMDSIFYINSCAPRIGAEGIGKIYFKKRPRK
ncbi:MAG: hypothetical protein R2788_21295 [Saprospiraceae bacterium]